MIFGCGVFSLAGPASTLVALLSVVPAQAPRQPAVPSTASTAGSVVGFVSDAETKIPIRFAEIRLVPKSAAAAEQPETRPNPSGAPEPQLRLVVGSSGFDGSFRLDGVPAGDYFVAALKPGYVTPGGSTRIGASEDQLKRLLPSLPAVHVVAGQAASVKLVLHRGGVIAGQLLFADGSPATGQTVSADEAVTHGELRGKTVSAMLETVFRLVDYGNHRREVLTDDRGRYRIFGLPPGKYVVSTVIGLDHNASARVLMSDGSTPHSSRRQHLYPEMIAIYEPGVFRRGAARVFEIRGDEQILGADLKMDPSGLHTLTGRVLAAGDRHAPSGVLVLLREPGMSDVSRSVDIEDDGSFEIHYLPPGSYKLQIAGNDSGPRDSPKPLVVYKTVRLSVVMGDHDVLLEDVLLTPLKQGEKDDDQDF